MYEEVKELTLPEVLVVSYRYQGEYQAMKHHFQQLETLVGNMGGGPPFSLYFDTNYENIADIEVCYPIREAIEVAAPYSIRRVPKMEVFTIFHQGSYLTLPKGYHFLEEYMKEQGYLPAAPSREIYLNGFQKAPKGHPELNQTQIAIPFSNKRL